MLEDTECKFWFNFDQVKVDIPPKKKILGLDLGWHPDPISKSKSIQNLILYILV